MAATRTVPTVRVTEPGVQADSSVATGIRGARIRLRRLAVAGPTLWKIASCGHS